MCEVNIKQLCSHFDKVIELHELQNARDGMKDYRCELSENLPESDALKNITDDIAKLDKRITEVKLELETAWVSVEKFLSCIKDDVAVNAIRLHYRDGMSWTDIAYITKYSSDEGVKSRVYRAIKKHSVKK